MDHSLDQLKQRLREISDLNAINTLLYWDQSTYMPPGGAEARGRQLALIGELSHHKFTDPAIGHLLADLRERPDLTATDAALVRVTQRDYDQAVRMPSEFVAELYGHASASYQAWTVARPADDWATMEPYLQKTVELSRRMAEFFPGYAHIADPLIDQSDEGMTVDQIKPLFAELRQQLVPLVEAITAQPPADQSMLQQHYPEAAQEAFGLAVAQQLGYDVRRGRQDRAPHPFMTKFGLGDVRITTRFQEHDLQDGLFSTIHETGHALYEQGIDQTLDGTPLASGTSAGVHESQSRLWENLVGRSRPFWQHFYPKLQATFPDQLGSVDPDTFYRAINRVARSLIRTDADEVTYNLHVIIRFDLELALLDGDLHVRDLPGAWRERYTSDLGITPPDDRDGVLQDMHWYSGIVGGQFQGYTLGNILSAQYFDAALRANPSITDAIGRGEFGTLRGWLTDQIYQYGRVYSPTELTERVAGGPLSIGPYMRYLRTKFGELYTIG